MRISVILTCLALVLGLTACKESRPLEGGVTDASDPDAPTHIGSKDINDFSVSFYVLDDFEPALNGPYYLSVTKDGESCLLKETDHYNIEEKVSLSFLGDMQEIIDRHRLVALNGTNRVTAGLPAEFRDCFMSVLYESGETLSFNIDGDPYDEWCRDIAVALRRELIAAGHEELIPPKKTVTHYNISFRKDDTRYEYSFIIDKNGDLKICRHIITGDDSDLVIKDIPEDYNSYLLSLVEDLELRRFHSGSLAGPDKTELHLNDYYEIYIDFDDGTQIYGHSNKEEDLQAFNAIENELLKRLDIFFQ